MKLGAYAALLPIIACGLCVCGCTRREGPGPTQSQFCSLVRTYIRSYLDAQNSHANEVALSQLRFDRKHALDSLMTGGQEFDWTGRVLEISTDSDGTGNFEIVLACGSKLPSEGALFGPDVLLYSDPQIEPGTPLYSTLSLLKKDQKVVFTGEFKYMDNHFDDFIHEKSATELGSMTRPEFSFLFTNVKLLSP